MNPKFSSVRLVNLDNFEIVFGNSLLMLSLSDEPVIDRKVKFDNEENEFGIFVFAPTLIDNETNSVHWNNSSGIEYNS